MTRFDSLKLILRAIMETGIVVALAYWGYERSQTAVTKVLFAGGVTL